MPICQIDQCFVLVKISLNPNDIAPLLQRHTNDYSNIDKLEAFGAQLVREDFPEVECSNFVESVCKWGRGDRNVGRVLKRNERADIARALREGHDIALSGDVPGGVSRIAKLKYLGISYASKQLRVLLPDRAVILDSVIRIRLGYAESASGYTEFLSDCEQLLAQIQRQTCAGASIHSKWRICDIEAAIYQQLQEAA